MSVTEEARVSADAAFDLLAPDPPAESEPDNSARNTDADAPAPVTEPESKTVFLSEIVASPLNPREMPTGMDNAVDALADSIRAVGILQPLVVRPVEDEWGIRYEIVAGHRRCVAAGIAGLEKVPVIVRYDISDQSLVALALTENLQREDLSPIEEARGYRSLLELSPGLTQAEVAQTHGFSQGQMSKKLALLRLDAYLQERIIAGVLSASHGALLASVEDYDTRDAFAMKAMREEWSFARLEDAIREHKRAEEARQATGSMFATEEPPAAEPAAEHERPELPPSRHTADMEARVAAAAATEAEEAAQPVPAAAPQETPPPGRPPIPGTSGPAAPSAAPSRLPAAPAAPAATPPSPADSILTPQCLAILTRINERRNAIHPNDPSKHFSLSERLLFLLQQIAGQMDIDIEDIEGAA